jgi:hypothetical protein
MRWIPAIFAAGLTVLPAQAQTRSQQMPQQIGPVTPIGAATVAVFLNGCTRDANGCQLAVGSALLDKIDVVNGPAQICTPTGSDIGQPVANWLRQHPETHSLATEDAIFAALKALYPCHKEAAAGAQ